MEITQLIFALLRIAVCGAPVTEEVENTCTDENLEVVYAIAAHHDIAHLVGVALGKMNIPIGENGKKCKHAAKKAFARYMQQEYAFGQTCAALEDAKIQFIPLKGSVLRAYYPEAWLRNSSDADILVKATQLDMAQKVLTEKLGYRLAEKTGHDISFFSPNGIHIELHFDLVEEGRANAASQVLCQVWADASLLGEHKFWHQMSDGMFYFYHIAHMAKHFEAGGCGIRPFIDLWILDHKLTYDPAERDALLQSGELLRFAEVARKLSRVWLDGEEEDSLSGRLQSFLLLGGVYGSTANRVALQKKGEDKHLRYVLSRVFVPYEKLKAYYPILKKHRWLIPAMQVRRWFMLLRPDVFKRAKKEMATSKNMDSTYTDRVTKLLHEVGLNTTAW